MEINFDLDKLVQYNLSFEAYFVLYCLNENREKELLTYTRNCTKIDTNIFTSLEQKQLITINRDLVIDNKISYSALKITSEGKDLFKIQDFDMLFEELKSSYPSKVEKTGRRLHLDLKKCKVLYKKIISVDISLHNLICKCAKLCHADAIRTNREDYMQNLATWLHQENYKAYIDEAKKDSLILEKGVQSEDI